MQVKHGMQWCPAVGLPAARPSGRGGSVVVFCNQRRVRKCKSYCKCCIDLPSEVVPTLDVVPTLRRLQVP